MSEEEGEKGGADSSSWERERSSAALPLGVVDRVP